MADWWIQPQDARRDPPGVINVRVAELRSPRRPGCRVYHDLAAWLAASPNHVYCGRRVQRVPATFDSPFRNDVPGVTQLPQDAAISAFEHRFREKLERDPELIRQLVGLLGKTLGCWCKPNDCHCDILLKLAEEYSNIVPGSDDDGRDDADNADDDWEDEEDYGDFAIAGAAVAPRGNRGGAGNARGGSGGGRRRVDGKESVYSARHVRRRMGSGSS